MQIIMELSQKVADDITKTERKLLNICLKCSEEKHYLTILKLYGTTVLLRMLQGNHQKYDNIANEM